jgi:hypothetical protein
MRETRWCQLTFALPKTSLARGEQAQPLIFARDRAQGWWTIVTHVPPGLSEDSIAAIVYAILTAIDREHGSAPASCPE